jgi:hypothetical protein
MSHDPRDLEICIFEVIFDMFRPTFQHQIFNYGRFYKLVENEQILPHA